MPEVDRSPSAPILRESVQVLVISMTLMLFEVNLVRLFSILTFFHLAFFVLAIALFGIGIGGLYGQILRERWAVVDRLPRAAYYLPLALGVSILVAVSVLVVIPLGQTTSEGVIGSKKWILCAFLVSAMPFFFGSMFVSMMFAARPHAATKLYFSDLAGASVGCLLAVAALQWLGGLTTPFLAAGIAVLPALFAKDGAKTRLKFCAGGLLAVIVVLGLSNERWDLLTIERKTASEGQTLFSQWNFFSRIEIEEFPQWRGWRPSAKYQGPVPEHLRITQDGRAPAFIVRFDGDFNKVEYLRYDITSVPFYIVSPQKTLIIGVGGGRDVLAAKLFGAPSVRGVELNPIIVHAMREPFREYSGDVYELEGVDIVTDNGRTFVNRDRETYDLIFQSLADTQLGNTQGAYVLSENYLYTVEAYESYWDRLSPEGVCCTVSSVFWGDQLTRLAGTAAKALENKGIADPGRHILVVMTSEYGEKTKKGMCLVMAKNPLTPEMLARAQRACDDLGYDLVWPAMRTPHAWTDGIGQLVDPKRRGAFVAAQPLDLSPLVDDRPYFFYGTKPSDLLRSLLNLGDRSREIDLRMRAFHLLVDLFLVVFACVLVLMLSPLVVLRRAELRRQARPLQIAFLVACFLLGVAYMLIEISVLQRLFVLLGDPTLTFAVTLCAMLAFTGLGSLLSGRVPSDRVAGFITKAAGAAIALQLAAWMILPALLKTTQGAGLGLKFLVVAVLLAGLATPMGMLFPSLIRLVGRTGLNMTCWVWGMNGVGSVLGSVGATLVSMNGGIHVTYLVGVAAYGAIALIALYLQRHVAAMGQASERDAASVSA